MPAASRRGADSFLRRRTPEPQHPAGRGGRAAGQLTGPVVVVVVVAAAAGGGVAHGVPGRRAPAPRSGGAPAADRGPAAEARRARPRGAPSQPPARPLACSRRPAHPVARVAGAAPGRVAVQRASGVLPEGPRVARRRADRPGGGFLVEEFPL